MGRLRWYLAFIAALLLSSFVLYNLQINIFHRSGDTFFYFLQDMAFVPMQVLLVTLIVDRLLDKRERETMLNKLNMVIGVFFSEAGIKFIDLYLDFDSNGPANRELFVINQTWENKDFKRMLKTVKNLDYAIDVKNGDLKAFRDFLAGKRDLILRLLENPNLLEHESFSDLLWAISHLFEELMFRKDLVGISDVDAKHLSNDMKRVFSLMLYEWFNYMNYLRLNYPYLYSLSIRTNPFDKNAAAELAR